MKEGTFMANKTSHVHAIMALVSLCIMYIVFTGVVFNTITLYMEPIITDYPDISRTQFMVTITLMGGLNAILTLAAFGPLVTKFGLRKCMAFGAIVIVIALVILANAQNLAMLYIGGVLFGIGITFESNGSTSIGVTTWFAKRSSTMIAICTTAGGVAGIIFAPVVGGWIAGVGWRMSFYIAAIITAVCSIVMIYLYKDSPAKVNETPMFSDAPGEAALAENAETPVAAVAETGPSFKGIWKTPQLYLLLVGYFITGVVMYSVMGNMAIFSADHGFDAVTQGTVLSVIFAATAIAMIPFGIIADKFGTKILLAICFVAIIAALAILMQAEIAGFMIYVAAALIGVAYVAVNVPVAISAREGLGTRDFAQKMPIVLGAMLAGVALGNPILQLFYDLGGSYTMGFIVYIVLAVVAAIFMFPGTKTAKGD
jgi:MFS family permease